MTSRRPALAAKSRSSRILMDVLMGVLLVMIVLKLVVASEPVLLPTLRVVAICGNVGLGLCWAGWRVTGDRRWVIALGLLLGVAMLGGGGGMLLVLLLSVLALIAGLGGLGWAAVELGYIVVVGIGLMISYGTPVRDIAVQSASVVVLGILGMVAGQTLHELDEERRENARLVDELRASQAIEAELMLAEERSRSARELHDGLGHRLTLIGMSLDYAVAMRDRDQDQAFAEVTVAREQASEALGHMRRWVRALNPPREASLKGTAAFDAIADSFRGTGLTVEVHEEGAEHELGREASLFAYRLVQEGLTNVLRHSQADRVDLTVRWLDDGVEIELADNGIDCGGRIGGVEAGFGLRSLAERAEELGGAFAARVGDHGMVLRGSVHDRGAA